MSKFNTKKESTRTQNLAGGKAFSHSPEMELITATLTTFLGDKYYESGEERIERIRALIPRCDAQFTANLAIIARHEFNLRSVSHLLVAELSKHHNGDSLVKRTVEAITIRPDDLLEIKALAGKSNQVKKGIRKALHKFDRYQLAKYRAENKKIKLVDLFNATHPKPTEEEQSKNWADLINGDLKLEGQTWESELSKGGDKQAAWKKMLLENKLGYMALLRNLRNIEELNDPHLILRAASVIVHPERIKKSKQLPFRFWTAYQNVRSRELLDAVSIALEHSVDNVPEFEGNTLVAIDDSGSMQGRPMEIASLFAAALLKKNGADVVLFDEKIRQLRYPSGTPVMALSQLIQNAAQWGGTNTSLVFTYAAQQAKKYDRIIILSDNESWQDSRWSGGTQDAYNAYRKINDCRVYAVDIEGYGTKDIESEKVFHIAGWSEKIFDFMKWMERKGDIVEWVKNYER